MSNIQKNNKKCKTLFGVSMMAYGIGLPFLIAFILSVVGIISFPVEGLQYACIAVAAVLVFTAFILFFVSAYNNFHYRKECEETGTAPGAFSTFLYWWSFILLWPYMLIIKVMAYLRDAGDDGLKKAVVKGSDGKEYNLTQKFIGGSEYTDQFGDDWETSNGGQTFKRVTRKIKAEDKSGNKKTLTQTYDGGFTKHYQDQDGEEWKSHDDGNTFEHVVTHATVKDKDGNEYSLRATSAPGHFIDQNGDYWITYDGGKTFERK